jgi:predicted nucleotidyltransferase
VDGGCPASGTTGDSLMQQSQFPDCDSDFFAIIGGVRDVFSTVNPMLTREDVLQILRDNKERFAEKYGVTKLGLFGSFARNEATEESDVDVCVELDEVTFDIMLDLREEIMEKTSRPVDLIQVRNRMNNLLKKRIERDAVYV